MSNQQPRSSANSENLGAAAMGMPVFEDGHDLHPIIRRAALATSTKWVDALVTSAAANGRIELRAFATGETLVRWHHADLGEVLAAGTPVAVHELYSVLAVGDELLSVRAA
ncbi:hypothetical protein [Frondihabitans cladoniiphilus]|uniref:Uncharacterized protein n=1 Tax=Frondihabitans cladoniiphilus TaxID=715785 RepID=A0ABP8VPF9_9MICO